MTKIPLPQVWTVSDLMKKKILITLAVILLVLLGTFFFVVPAQLEKRLNVSLNPPPYLASERAVELHKKLLVADLHADSLLWDRDLLDHATRGHVDIPRLIEGNVAVQSFTIVTKTPYVWKMNIERNDDSTDNITILGIAQRWPTATWSSLTGFVSGKEAAGHGRSLWRQVHADPNVGRAFELP